MSKSIVTIYKEDVVPKREELFGVKNIHAIPRIQKVVINARIKRGGAADEEKVLNTLSKITGQKAIPTKARLSISNFKIREGQVLGGKVTLRGARAYHFLDRLINITFPRVRDFSGLSTKAFDGHGSYTVGFQEHNVFPETAADDVSQLHGLEITIVTSAKKEKDTFTLLKTLGFPFKK
ncbi:50S ribosomal protein L5 [bacterium CG10_46_32]|nr:MAG: 50S ribosomal protein L5 [bacterium CG10_46_32]PIR56401.1 MAG: 50S ribosomal protein L5 [Parcubacteria group bacterium CG10_big_fil_rev_8_21_14_0_10_46_32]